jgi:dUTP pyrophosphatase
MQLQIKKVNPNAIIPTRAYSLDSGIDLTSPTDMEVITLQPLERRMIDTGIVIQLPEPKLINCNDGTTELLVYEGQVRAKSGRSAKEGLGILNSPGTVDNEYTGNIIVIAVNLSNEPITIKPGQKIAQFVVLPVIVPTVIEVEEIQEHKRGSNGFGSTGI